MATPTATPGRLVANTRYIMKITGGCKATADSKSAKLLETQAATIGNISSLVKVEFFEDAELSKKLSASIGNQLMEIPFSKQRQRLHSSPFGMISKQVARTIYVAPGEYPAPVRQASFYVWMEEEAVKESSKTSSSKRGKQPENTPSTQKVLKVQVLQKPSLKK